MKDADPFALERFVQAQASTYEGVLAELRGGCKRSHWMWFIFPQLSGLGRSSTAQFYAITGINEARAYLAHSVLGARLRECSDALLLQVSGKTALEILGSPDDLKLHSSMTLFSRIGGQDSVFTRVLDFYYGGLPDQRTLALLR